PREPRGRPEDQGPPDLEFPRRQGHGRAHQGLPGHDRRHQGRGGKPEVHDLPRRGPQLLGQGLSGGESERVVPAAREEVSTGPGIENSEGGPPSPRGETMQTLILLLALAQSSWDLEALGRPPRAVPAEGFDAPGLSAVFYEGPAWKGNPTRVFAWVGLPRAQGKVPGMVLIHGGGGTA